MKIKTIMLTLLILLLGFELSSMVLAQDKITCQSEYVVQVNDWLMKIAAKHYDNPSAFSAIVEATNAQAATDNSFTFISNPNIILPGWKLCLPPAETTTSGIDGASKAQTETQHFIGLTTGPDESGIIEAQRFPLRDERKFVVGSVLSLFDFDQDPPVPAEELPGSVRLALARPVSNFDEPEELEMETAVKWVLLAPAGNNEAALIWQEITQKSISGATTMTSEITERAISEVLPFAQDTTSPEASLLALFETLGSRYDEDTNAGLWVDFLLFEGTDSQGAPEWVLYAFAQPPGAPAGEDRAVTFCCKWLRCYTATSACRFWGCLGVCR